MIFPFRIVNLKTIINLPAGATTTPTAPSNNAGRAARAPASSAGCQVQLAVTVEVGRHQTEHQDVELRADEWTEVAAASIHQHVQAAKAGNSQVGSAVAVKISGKDLVGTVADGD